MDAVATTTLADIGTLQDQARHIDVKKAAASGARSKDIAAAAQDFEAMFASQLMQPMMETAPVDDVFGGGAGEEAFRGFLTQEYGRIAAKAGAIGVSSAVKDVMLHIQAMQSHPADGVTL